MPQVILHRTKTNRLLLISILLSALVVEARGDVIGFDSDRWVLKDAEIVHHLDRDCLSGVAYLKDVEFENGVIEVDIAVDGTRSYPGIIFRMQSEADYEYLYMRPHASDSYTDRLQYAPVFNRVTSWQLYNGEGFTAPAVLPMNRWMHLKMEIHGRQARVYLDESDRPALIIHDLKHGRTKGTLGVMGPKSRAA